MVGHAARSRPRSRRPRDCSTPGSPGRASRTRGRLGSTRSECPMPPPSALQAERIAAARRRGKHLIVEVDGGGGDRAPGSAPAHSNPTVRRAPAVYDKPAEVALSQSAAARRAPTRWLRAAPAPIRLDRSLGEAAARGRSSKRDDALATLGPEAWPDPGGPARLQELLERAAARCTRCCTTAHDRRHSSASSVDQILWQARAPRRCGAAPTSTPGRRRRATPKRIVQNPQQSASSRCEHTVALPIPDKLPMPLHMHRRRASRAPAAAPRCGRSLRGLRHRLLPRVPDRGARAQGSPPVAAAHSGVSRPTWSERS